MANPIIFDSVQKIWRNNLPSTKTVPDVTLGEIILSTLKRNPSQIAQISDNNGVQITNAEMYLKTVRAAQNITRLGYQKGDIFAVAAANSHHLAPIIFAAFSMGCPINVLATDVVHMFEKTRPKLVFCDNSNVDTIRENLEKIGLPSKIYTFDGPTAYSNSVDDLLKETGCEDQFKPITMKDKHEAAIIVSTSGTTGFAKGVILTHLSLLERILNVEIFNSNEVSFSYSNLNWITGLIMLLYGTLYECTRIITTQQFDPEEFPKIIEKYKVSVVLTPPIYLALTLKHKHYLKCDLSSIRSYLCGGSAVSDVLIQEIQKYLPNGSIDRLYGISELSSLVTINVPPKFGSVGLLAFDVKAKVIDDDGKRLGVNESGEICLQYPIKFKGYYADEEKTKKCFDDEEWFLTGDVGYFDEDGYLFLADRKDDLIRAPAIDVYPSEMESILIRHPAISQVCVVGIPYLELKELPTAMIVVNNDHEITEQQVHDMIAEHQPEQKRLDGGVYFVNSLPTTPAGKVLRRIVKQTAFELYNRRQSS